MKRFLMVLYLIFLEKYEFFVSAVYGRFGGINLT